MRDPSDIVDVLGHRPVDGDGVEMKVRYVDGAVEWRRARVDVSVEHRDADGELVSSTPGVLA